MNCSVQLDIVHKMSKRIPKFSVEIYKICHQHFKELFKCFEKPFYGPRQHLDIGHSSPPLHEITWLGMEEGEVKPVLCL